MLFAGLSCAVAAMCIALSALRLAWAVALTTLDPVVLLQALKAREWLPFCAGVKRTMAEAGGFHWEAGLLEAFMSAEAGPARDALVNEELTELDGRAERWSRVPRVCASVATSAGFLLGSLCLVQGVSLVADPSEGASVVASAITAVAVGVSGTAFSYAVHVRARRIVKDRLAAVDRLIAYLDTAARAALPAQGDFV